MERRRKAQLSRGTGVRTGIAALVSLLAVALLAGCGLTIPTDPDGTLDRISGGELRVGFSPDPGLVEGETTGEDDGAPSGSLPDLVTGFADEIGAEVEWTEGSEETLVGMLESGDLDLVIGGITSDTPWADRAGVTRGYPGIDGADGRDIVMLVPLGENAVLSALERHLDGLGLSDGPAR
nr:transporter substrate-binding domain-containing protein [uncultured Microbacterium sp.]